MFVSLLPSSTVPLLIINTATNMSGSVNMKEALHEANPGRSECYPENLTQIPPSPPRDNKGTRCP